MMHGRLHARRSHIILVATSNVQLLHTVPQYTPSPSCCPIPLKSIYNLVNSMLVYAEVASSGWRYLANSQSAACRFFLARFYTPKRHSLTELVVEKQPASQPRKMVYNNLLTELQISPPCGYMIKYPTSIISIFL